MTPPACWTLAPPPPEVLPPVVLPLLAAPGLGASGLRAPVGVGAVCDLPPHALVSSTAESVMVAPTLACVALAALRVAATQEASGFEPFMNTCRPASESHEL